MPTTTPTKIGKPMPTELIALDGALGDLARTADDVRREAFDQRAKVEALGKKLNRARQHDADAMADAIEHGKKVPAPTEAPLRAELDEATRQLAGLATRSRRAAETVLSALCGDEGTTLATTLADRIEAAPAEVAPLLDQLAEVLGRFVDDVALARFIATARRWNRLPAGPPHANVQITANGIDLEPNRWIELLLLAVATTADTALGRGPDDDPDPLAIPEAQDQPTAEPSLSAA